MENKRTLEKLLKSGVRIYESLPDGRKIDRRATTAPVGYVWINNGESRFLGKYKHGIMLEAD